jgi:putative ABC transport system permease protein
MNSIRSLGIVWIPGLMAGMLIAGESPVNAALYQFVVMGMIFISVSLCSLICSLQIRKEVFSKAQQLVLRPENQ